MRTAITNDDVIDLLEKMATAMEAQKGYLCELDGAIGDGDQGVTMAIGFGAIRAALSDLKGQDIGTILMKSGMAFNGKAASTIGVLFLTACMRAGREVKGLTEIRLAELVKMAEAAAAGVRERGKAEVGDKTVLDALVPGVVALKTAAVEGYLLSEALVRSLAAAEAGMKGTVPLKSKVGRASWIADRTVGHQDPGATSFYLMWKSAVEYLTAG